MSLRSKIVSILLPVFLIYAALNYAIVRFGIYPSFIRLERAEARKVTYKSLTISMGIVNVISGMIGGLPVCHGAGGLAAHYRFGARTGGSNIMIGSLFVLIALVFGHIAISLLSSIPHAILGTLLLFSGLELSMLIRDVKEKKELFIVLIVAGIGFVTTNMGVAFLIGIILNYIIKWKCIRV